MTSGYKICFHKIRQKKDKNWMNIPTNLFQCSSEFEHQQNKWHQTKLNNTCLRMEGGPPYKILVALQPQATQSQGKKLDEAY